MAAHSHLGAIAAGRTTLESSEEPNVSAAAPADFADDAVEDFHAARRAEQAGLARHQVDDMPSGAELCRREDDDGGVKRFMSRWGDLKNALKHKRWVWAYEAEFARELHAQRRQYLRSAGCCMVLALLAAMGAA